MAVKFSAVISEKERGLETASQWAFRAGPPVV